MLNPCQPCVCPGAPCEQCSFGYQSKESNHESMKELILDYLAGKKSVGWRCAELYMNYHKNWREELDEDVVEELLKNSSNETSKEMQKINLNEVVKVKLTKLGKEIYYHQFDSLIQKGVKIIPSYPKEDKDGFCHFQLWVFMQLYGPHIGMALPKVVDDLNIYF